MALNQYEMTFLLPCLNEEKTIGLTIKEIKDFIARERLKAEILVVDNGSVDASAEIAKKLGAKVIYEPNKGYGQALRTGIKAASGKYILMGDADTTYDFLHAEVFLEKLRQGYLLVVGNRYLGGFEKGAMPWHHYYGVKLLSWLGKRKYHVPVGDFHCGLRAFQTKLVQELSFQTTGMEFATETIALIAKETTKIIEVPTKLKKCNISRKPHLRTVRDGWRHLKYILWN